MRWAAALSGVGRTGFTAQGRAEGQAARGMAVLAGSILGRGSYFR